MHLLATKEKETFDPAVWGLLSFEAKATPSWPSLRSNAKTEG